MMLCLLLYMKSPTTYNFLRDNNILVLPCTRTIRKYLSVMDTPCGFDPKFFEVLKEHFEGKSVRQRHVILMMDEMKTRKNIAADIKNMTYKGLVDFGTNEADSGIVDKADHGLVLMFVPLYDTYSQTIAVFTSKGPTVGVTLTKLIIQAIVLLERAGAIVHGVVCDGATTNRRFWTELGMSGKRNNFKNYFTHPSDVRRKVFAFSDICHLMKNVRNRMENKKSKLKVHPDEACIDWDYFHVIYDLDRPKPQAKRMCPKLTTSHLTLNSFSKMRVSYAVQILSKAMAKALRHYKAYDSRLAGCETTADFCERFNNLFDILNKLKPEEGLTMSSADLQVIEYCLKWLDDWETRVHDGLLTKENFKRRILLKDFE